jgi:histidyl-tRNA synthetase
MAPLIERAPVITDHLCAACADHLSAVVAHLDAAAITPRMAPLLVRGLDYYTRTAFEFYRAGAEGQQQALGGGGRYDGLVELLGGQPTPSIGFGLGLDRVVAALAEQGVEAPAPARPEVVVVGAGVSDTVDRFRVGTLLREAGVAVRIDLAHRKLGRQLDGAAREGAHFAVICGDELAAGQVQLKDLQAGTQRRVDVADLARELQRASTQHRHGPRGT